PPTLPSLPTRRSSDLRRRTPRRQRAGRKRGAPRATLWSWGQPKRKLEQVLEPPRDRCVSAAAVRIEAGHRHRWPWPVDGALDLRDRKSTRLNSSHVKI